MSRLAPFILAGLIILALPELALPGLGPLDLPLRALLVFPALGLLARWSDAPPGESHDP